jgi:hypothetical protein
MRVIIAGSRNIDDRERLMSAIRQADFEITEVVSGGASGVDRLGEIFALESEIPVKRFHPDWDTYGRAAGPMRNRRMAQYADALIAIWDGESRGTKNMIEEMEKLNKHVFILRLL